jgi:hypothetical protein
MTTSGDGRQPATIRRSANALARAAAWLLPDSQQRWATAMIHEVASIERDREALRWSAGCLYAACLARTRSFYLLDIAAIRWGLVLIATFRALDVSLPTTLTAAYTMRRGMACGLGELTPGGNVRRLIPLVEAIPIWLHALILIGACCYLSAVVSTCRRQPIAAVFLLLGVASEQLASLAARPIIAEVGVVAMPHSSLIATLILPIVLPLLFAAAAASGSRRTLMHIQ